MGILGAAGTAIGGPVGATVGSLGESVVKTAVSRLVNSVVGVFDPGKARDAQREARAEMWYQLAIQGSTFAGRHVLGGRTLVYTVKEKGYYEARWNQLRANNPFISRASELLGGVGIPDNPSDADISQMAQEIDAYNNRDVITMPPQFAGAGITAGFTPMATPLAPPVAQVPIATQRTLQATMLPPVITNALANKTAWPLYIGVTLAVIGLVYFASRKS